MYCSIYDWMSQSNEHLQHGRVNWPLSYDLYSRSPDRSVFLELAQGLSFPFRRTLKAEHDNWFSHFGYAWKHTGCLRENRLRERNFVMTAPVVSGLGAASVFDSDYGEDWGDYEGTSQGDLPPMYTGTPAIYGEDPKPPVGYAVCYNPQVQGMPVTVDVPTAEPGWRVDHYAGSDNQLYYFYHHDSSGDSFWACPQKASAAAPRKEEVKQIQRALSKRGYNPGTIDGVWGPKTCSAAYAYSYSYLGYADPTLTEDYFASLGLGGLGFGARYARTCDSWFTGELGGPPQVIVEPAPVTPPIDDQPKPDPIVPVPIPEPKKAGFGWIIGLLIAGTIVGTAIVQGRKNKKGKGK